MDRGAWWATVCEVTKSRTQLTLSLHFHVSNQSHTTRAIVTGKGDSVYAFNLSLDFHQKDVINSIQVKAEIPE